MPKRTRKPQTGTKSQPPLACNTPQARSACGKAPGTLYWTPENLRKQSKTARFREKTVFEAKFRSKTVATHANEVENESRANHSEIRANHSSSAQNPNRTPAFRARTSPKLAPGKPSSGSKPNLVMFKRCFSCPDEASSPSPSHPTLVYLVRIGVPPMVHRGRKRPLLQETKSRFLAPQNCNFSTPRGTPPRGPSKNRKRRPQKGGPTFFIPPKAPRRLFCAKFHTPDGKITKICLDPEGFLGVVSAVLFQASFQPRPVGFDAARKLKMRIRRKAGEIRNARRPFPSNGGPSKSRWRFKDLFVSAPLFGQKLLHLRVLPPLTVPREAAHLLWRDAGVEQVLARGATAVLRRDRV